jgi:membrane-associated phospholipid phosphatase
MGLWEGKLLERTQLQSMDSKNLIGSLLLVTLLVTLSYRLLDIRVALYAFHSDTIKTAIHTVLGTLPPLAGNGDQIRDFLPPLTTLITAISWTGYFTRVRQGICDQHTLFFKIVGTAVPLAFLVKVMAKDIFGRINTRVWVADPNLYDGFHWLHGGGRYDGFPSGHMTVLTPLLVALWHYYPRYRPLYTSAFVALAISLVLTDYHFVSDVIAGAYLGMIVYCFTNQRLASRTTCLPGCSSRV